MNNTPQKNDNIILLIFPLLLILLLFWWFLSGKRTTGGGGGGGGTPTVCNPSLWTSKPIILPESFIAEKTNMSECDAQKFGQDNSINAFIRCNDGGVMFLNGDNSFTGTETACTDCKIYYTRDFTVTLKNESPPHMPIVEGADSPLPPPTSGACPQNPYPYCDIEGDISKVYITLNCHASTELVKKLITEGKLSGHDDPKIIKCCKDPGTCRAAGISAFPTVICSGYSGRTIQGFCP
jgi:hypothetical protein